MLILLKIIFLFIAILFSISYFGRICYKENILPSHLIIQTIGIIGFIYLQWLV